MVSPVSPENVVSLQSYTCQSVAPGRCYWNGTFPPLLLCSHPVHVWLFATPRSAACQASLFLTISWSLPKFMSIASVMPSSHLILWHPLFLLPSIFPSIRDFSNESAVHIRWPKNWSFSFSISPSSEYSGLISLKISITNKQQTWDDKSSIRTRMPYDKFPWELEWPNRVLLMTLCCETLVYSTGYQMHPSTSSGCKDQTEYTQSSQSQAFRTQNQMEEKTSYSSHIRGIQQSLPKQRQVWRKLLSYQSVCGASLDSKCMKGLCLMFFPMVLPSYDKWHIRHRQRKAVTILGRKISIKIESTHLPNIRVTRSPRTSSTDIFSC